jgi:NADPH:quinone reductase-like Zn-dependent oxidoreductase
MIADEFLGTGGVSLFALQLAQKLGFHIIITSSSDAKLERAKELGPALTINYKTHPQWEDEATRLTGNLGVDLVVDQGGAATLLQSVSALRKGGRVSQVGLLTSESRGNFVPLIQMLIMKACCIQ